MPVTEARPLGGGRRGVRVQVEHVALSHKAQSCEGRDELLACSFHSGLQLFFFGR